MIRKFEKNDIDEVMRIWKNENIEYTMNWSKETKECNIVEKTLKI